MANCFVGGAPLLLVAVVALQWNIIDIVTPFLFFPILLVVFGLFLLGVFWVIFKWVRTKKHAQSVAMLAYSFACLAIVSYVNFTDIWLDNYFTWYEQDRDRIVAAVYDGSLKPNVGYNDVVIRLPDGYPKVSMGGNDIIVEVHDNKKYILFFTFRGILDNYSGFLHVPEGGDPRRYRDLSDSTTQIIQWKGRWFYVSHH